MGVGTHLVYNVCTGIVGKRAPFMFVDWDVVNFDVLLCVSMKTWQSETFWLLMNLIGPGCLNRKKRMTS